MTFNISYNFEAIDNFTNVAHKISKSVDRLTAKISKFRQKVKNAGKAMTDLGKKMMLRVSAPIIGFGVAAVKASSDIEDLNIAFETMMHSAKKAKNMVEALTDFAARTPFHLEDIGGAAKTLLNIGTSANKVIPILKKLSDIAAITKMPLESLVSVYARVHQRGKMTIRELMPLVRAHTGIVGMLKKMATEAGHPNVDVYAAVGKGAATAAVFDRAIARLTTGMGMFAGGADKMSHTISGLFSTIRDSIKFYFLRPIGDIIIDSLHLQKRMQALILWFGKAKKAIVAFGKTHKKLAKIIVIVALITAALAPVLIALGTMVFLTGLVAVGFEAIWGAILSPITLTVITIAAIVAGFIELYKHMASVRLVANIILGVIKIIWFVVKTILVLFFKLFMLVNKGLLVAFKAIAHVVMTLIVRPIMKMIKGIESIFSIFSKHKGKIEMKKSMMMQHSPFFTRQQTFAPLAMPQQRVRSDVNISLHDPGNAVNRMYGKSDGGDLGFNLGTNMLSSYL